MKPGSAARICRALWLAVLIAVPSLNAQTDPRRSGFEFMSSAIQAMQKDDALNPGMLWLAEGEAQWRTSAGVAQRTCQSCHGDASKSMRGVAARYPAFDDAAKGPLTLAMRIKQCRSQHQQVPATAAPAAPAAELLALETYVAHQSRGLPMAPPADPRLAADRSWGQQLFTKRFGQLDLSCANCHDDLAGKRLGGSAIPQGHATGYPQYRLEWQAVGNLPRRLRACMLGVRAEPFAANAREWVALELYLAQRAAGMLIETPAVRP